MKISVLEWNLASAGGRQQTMVSGFADCFAELGHDVRIYSNFLRGHIPNKDVLLKYHLTEHLTNNNFDFSHRIRRRSLKDMPADEWSSRDILLIPYPAFSWIGEYVTCPIVSWYIAQPERWWPEYITQVWTNSYTQKKRLGLDQARVVYAPHDYSQFRKYAKPWDDRKIDILMVGSVTKAKEEIIFLSKELKEAERLSKDGLKVLGLFLVKTSDEYQLLRGLSFDKYVNLPRRSVARYMGTSKVLFHPSPLESCSLVIYEALNAGCYPVVRKAGACKEQLEDVGFIYTEFEDANREISKVITSEYDENISISQGKKFDRKKTKQTIKKYLGEIYGRS